MVEVGKDSSRSSGPTPLLKQGHLQQVAQDRVQLGSDYLYGWQLYNLSFMTDMLTKLPIPIKN